MEIEREKEITETLGFFSFKQLQDCMTLFTFIKRKGIQPDEVAEVIAKRIRVNNRKIKRHRSMVSRMFRESHNYAKTMASLAEPVLFERCPTCGIPMNLNDNPAEGDSQWVCSRCRFGKYIDVSAKEETRRLHIAAHKTQRQEKTDDDQ